MSKTARGPQRLSIVACSHRRHGQDNTILSCPCRRCEHNWRQNKTALSHPRLRCEQAIKVNLYSALSYNQWCKNVLCFLFFIITRFNVFLFCRRFLFLRQLKYMLAYLWIIFFVKLWKENTLNCRFVLTFSLPQYFQYWERFALIQLQYQSFTWTLTTLPCPKWFCKQRF